MKKIKLILLLPLLFVSCSCSTNEDSFSNISSEDPPIIDSSEESSEPIIEWNNPTYIWNDDNSIVTASRSRKDDTTIVEMEEVNTNYEIIVEATCHSLGEGRYTSNAFNNVAFTVQRKTISIDMLNHQYGEAIYLWKDDGSVCYASISCINDGCNHIEEENVEGVLFNHIDPTCINDGCEMFEAVFDNPLFSRQEKEVVIPSTGNEHNWAILQRSDYISWADFGEGGIIDPGTATYTCTHCGETKIDYHNKFEWEVPLD